MFIVPVKSPGITVVPLRLLDGSVDFCQEYIEDAVIPVENVVGAVNDGWRVATTLMMNERTASGGAGRWAGGEARARTPASSSTGPLVDLAGRTGRLGDPHIRTLIGESWVLTPCRRRP